MSRCRAYLFRVHPSGLAAPKEQLSLIKPGFPGASPHQGAHAFLRTRVRKIRPQASTSLASLFLRHRLGPTRQGHRPIIRCVLGPSHGNSISIPAFVSLMARAVRRGSRSTGLPKESALSHSASLRREGESAVVCAVGTYCFCAALTRTAPLGLQLVTSFLRRSLSSPDSKSITQIDKRRFKT